MITRTLILALSLTIAASPATAKEIETEASAVRIDDLNLTRAADRHQLDVRVKSAARALCQTGLRGASESADRAECVAAAIARTGPQTQRAIARAQDGTQLALLMVEAAR
ncbi:UrcA family protein [Pararhizobium sp.]|uniref:UrcA family protein n=1 Tax=Pararhizobium sp. TaxID=1977563 RepID=UPI00271C0A9B|nr:UrcA family protein [Pararhizobium sp.]MDO9416494.1 UrcA family protein [Pararhizobium sp.]